MKIRMGDEEIKTKVGWTLNPGGQMGLGYRVVEEEVDGGGTKVEGRFRSVGTWEISDK